MVTRRMQIIPKGRTKLYAALVKKEIELYKKNKGTFYRAATKQKERTKWKHTSYTGWLKMQRMIGGGIVVEVRTTAEPGKEWQITHAFLGFLDRHFGDIIHSINIQY